MYVCMYVCIYVCMCVCVCLDHVVVSTPKAAKDTPSKQRQLLARHGNIAVLCILNQHDVSCRNQLVLTQTVGRVSTTIDIDDILAVEADANPTGLFKLLVVTPVVTGGVRQQQVRMHLCMYRCTHASKYVCLRVCMFVFMYAYIACPSMYAGLYEMCGCMYVYC